MVFTVTHENTKLVNKKAQTSASNNRGGNRPQNQHMLRKKELGKYTMGKKTRRGLEAKDSAQRGGGNSSKPLCFDFYRKIKKKRG